MTPSATRSETLRPLPSPPASELRNLPAIETIQANPRLFDVVTPINVDRFEAALATHPNRPLVESVVKGLREGFWPFADFEGLEVPESWEEVHGALSDEAAEFVSSYAVEEEQAGRYSPPFGSSLLPGMVCMPLYAVPKPRSDKLRLVNDHSAGAHALNCGISKCDVGMRQDNMQDFGRNLLHVRQEVGDIPLWLFKSDVSNAYRILPMHPLWQIKQVVKINGVYRIDRCCCFGCRGSPDLWCTFMSLVLWIAVNVKRIELLLAYMDDAFSHDQQHQLVWYAPYSAFFPSKQVRLLLLWDDLGIPHKQSKQVFGRSLTIIGFHVDADAMTISLPDDSRLALIDNIRSFVHDAPGRKRKLKEWQRLLGWCNWALNVQPLLRPALQSSWDKLRGKQYPNASIYLNKPVVDDLLWFAEMFAHSQGVYILKARAWSPQQCDLEILCDACLHGMGFWCPTRNVGFAAELPPVPASSLEDSIFWFEALTVLAALQWAASLRSPPSRLAIYTDNLNTVQMFDSLRASAPYNWILRSACEALITSGIDLRVWHIPGRDNIVADALSRQLLDVVFQRAPYLSIYPLIPPRLTLGVSSQ